MSDHGPVDDPGLGSFDCSRPVPQVVTVIPMPLDGRAQPTPHGHQPAPPSGLVSGTHPLRSRVTVGRMLVRLKARKSGGFQQFADRQADCVRPMVLRTGEVTSPGREPPSSR